jgi:hypothetical protein
MPADPEAINLRQPFLFDFQTNSLDTIELFPRVWGAAEALVDPNPLNRQAGLQSLKESRAARYSPLIGYLLFTRLSDPDLLLRINIIGELADSLSPDHDGQFAPEIVRQSLRFYFSQTDQNQILAMLEAAELDKRVEPAIVLFLKINCDAGTILADILTDRKKPVGLRNQAAKLIGMVGYVEAIPTIDRLISRLESRVNGQQSFGFNPLDPIDEAELLPTLKDVLAILKAP